MQTADIANVTDRWLAAGRLLPALQLHAVSPLALLQQPCNLTQLMYANIRATQVSKGCRVETGCVRTFVSLHLQCQAIMLNDRVHLTSDCIPSNIHASKLPTKGLLATFSQV